MAVTVPAFSGERRARSVATIPVSIGGRLYVVRMSPVSAHDVAAELRRLLPGVPAKKLHKLLYYCQGHHLAHFEEPLFTEPVMAWDVGPVVAKVWKVEKDHCPRLSRKLLPADSSTPLPTWSVATDD